jgi:hypothetical protein
MKEGNIYLKETFIKDFNDRFGVKAHEEKSSFRPVHPNFKLGEVFYTKVTRKVKNDHTISFKGKIIDLESGAENLSGKEIEIRSYPDGTERIFCGDLEIYFKDQHLSIAAG